MALPEGYVKASPHDKGYSHFARELVDAARKSSGKMAVVPVEKVPAEMKNFQRIIAFVSESTAATKVYRNKLVVIDLSWVKE